VVAEVVGTMKGIHESSRRIADTPKFAVNEAASQGPPVTPA
jgi:hypothetical protein